MHDETLQARAQTSLATTYYNTTRALTKTVLSCIILRFLKKPNVRNTYVLLLEQQFVLEEIFLWFRESCARLEAEAKKAKKF